MTMYIIHHETYAEECPTWHPFALVADVEAFAAEAAKGQDGQACPVCAGFARADAEAVAAPGQRQAYDVAYWAARMVLYELISERAEPERAATARAIADDVADDAACRADLGQAAGTAVSAAFRTVANWTAQQAGTADALGLDATGRLRSRSGRYDGADTEDEPPEFPTYVGWDGQEHAEF